MSSSNSTLNQLLTAPPNNYRLKEAVTIQHQPTSTPPTAHQQSGGYYSAQPNGQPQPQHPGFYSQQQPYQQHQQPQQYPPSGYGPPPPAAQYGNQPSAGYYGQPPAQQQQQYGAAPPPPPQSQPQQQQQQARYAAQYQQPPSGGVGPESAGYGQPQNAYGQPAWNQQQPPAGPQHQQPGGYPPQPQYQQTQYYGQPSQYAQQQHQLSGGYYQTTAPPPPQRSPAPPAQQQQDQRLPYDDSNSNGGNNKRPASRSSATGSSVGTSGPSTPNGAAEKKPKRRKPSPVAASAATPPNNVVGAAVTNNNQVFRPPHPVGHQQQPSPYGSQQQHQQNMYGAPPQQQMPGAFYGQQQPPPGMGQAYRQSPLPYQQQQQQHLTGVHPSQHPQTSPYGSQQQYQQGAGPYGYSTPVPGSMGPPPGQTYSPSPTIRGTIKSPAMERSLSTTPSGPLTSASPKTGRKKAAAATVKKQDDGETGSPPASPKVDGKSCELGLKPLYDMGTGEPGRRIWLDALGEHLDSIGRTLGKQPTVAKRPLDMYLLYEAVKLRGGFLQITKKRQLREVCDEIGFGNSSGTAAAVKKHYLRICLSYECVFDRGGADCKQMARDIDDSRARARCRKRPTARQKAKAEAAAAAAAAANGNTTMTDEDSASYASIGGGDEDYEDDEDGDPDASGSNSRSTGIISRRASSSAMGVGSSSQMSSAESGVVANQKQAGPGRPRKPRKKRLTKKELRAKQEAESAAVAESSRTNDDSDSRASKAEIERASPYQHMQQQQQQQRLSVDACGRQFPPSSPAVAPPHAAAGSVDRNPHLQQLIHQPLYSPGNRTPTPRNFSAPSPIPPQPQMHAVSSRPSTLSEMLHAAPSAPPPPPATRSTEKRSLSSTSVVPSMPVPLGFDTDALWPKNLPETCVENIKFISPSPSKSKLEKIKPKRWSVDKQPIDMWKLTMSLRSGLIAESSWALDTLAICLGDDINAVNASFQLSKLPRSLFDAVVEWFATLLYYAFPREFCQPMQSLKHTMMQLTMGNSPPSAGATPVSGKLTVLLQPPPSLKRMRLGEELREKISVAEPTKLRLDFGEEDSMMQMNDTDYFLLDDDPVPDVLRHYRPFVRTHHSCERTRSFELFCGSSSAAAAVCKKRPQLEIDLLNGKLDVVEQFKKDEKQVKVEAPKQALGSTDSVAERNSSPDSGTALSPAANDEVADDGDFSNAPVDYSNKKLCDVKNSSVSDKLRSSPPAPPKFDCEAENFGDPIFNLSTTSQAELHQRLLVCMQILRNLSFIPTNETVMAKNATLLRFLGKLIMLQHTHSERRPLSSGKIDAEIESDRPSTANEDEFDDRERSVTVALTFQLREHAFVILSNCSGFMELIQLPEDVAEVIVHGLLYWSSTQCTAGDEPFPVNDAVNPKREILSENSSLVQRLERLVTPKRIAIECLGKLTANQSNIDLIVTTPPFENVTKLFRTVSDHIALGKQDAVMRELCICLLSALLKTEDYVVNAIAKEVPQIFGHVLSFVEQIEEAARTIALTPNGLNALRQKPELMGTSLSCLRRCGEILFDFIKKLDPDYHCIVFRQQARILELLMSQVLEQQVANNLAKVMLRLQSPVEAFLAARKQRELAAEHERAKVAASLAPLSQQQVNSTMAPTITTTESTSSNLSAQHSTLLALLLKKEPAEDHHRKTLIPINCNGETAAAAVENAVHRFNKIDGSAVEKNNAEKANDDAGSFTRSSVAVGGDEQTKFDTAASSTAAADSAALVDNVYHDDDEMATARDHENVVGHHRSEHEAPSAYQPYELSDAVTATAADPGASSSDFMLTANTIHSFSVAAGNDGDVSRGDENAQMPMNGYTESMHQQSSSSSSSSSSSLEPVSDVEQQLQQQQELEQPRMSMLNGEDEVRHVSAVVTGSATVVGYDFELPPPPPTNDNTVIETVGAPASSTPVEATAGFDDYGAGDAADSEQKVIQPIE